MKRTKSDSKLQGNFIPNKIHNNCESQNEPFVLENPFSSSISEQSYFDFVNSILDQIFKEENPRINISAIKIMSSILHNTALLDPIFNQVKNYLQKQGKLFNNKLSTFSDKSFKTIIQNCQKLNYQISVFEDLFYPHSQELFKNFHEQILINVNSFLSDLIKYLETHSDQKDYLSLFHLFSKLNFSISSDIVAKANPQIMACIMKEMTSCPAFLPSNSLPFTLSSMDDFYNNFEIIESCLSSYNFRSKLIAQIHTFITKNIQDALSSSSPFNIIFKWITIFAKPSFKRYSDLQSILQDFRDAFKGKEVMIAEFFAFHVDSLFRKSVTSETINVLSYSTQIIDDFSTFQKKHSQLLIKRLLEFQGSTYQIELQFAKQLNDMYGYLLSHAIFEILNDYANETEFIKRFDNHGLLSIQLMKQDNWQQMKENLMPLPPEIKPKMEEFSQYFYDQNPKKRLSISQKLSTAELQFGKYQISCPAEFAIVLLQFNKKRNVSINDLHEALLLPEDIIENLLGTLIKSGILNQKRGLYSIAQISENIQIPILNSPNANDKNFDLKDLMQKQFQIDAQIMSVVKKFDGMDSEKIKEKLNISDFTIDDAFINQRLEYLTHKGFISLDSSGSYHFLP